MTHTIHVYVYQLTVPSYTLFALQKKHIKVYCYCRVISCDSCGKYLEFIQCLKSYAIKLHVDASMRHAMIMPRHRKPTWPRGLHNLSYKSSSRPIIWSITVTNWSQWLPQHLGYVNYSGMRYRQTVCSMQRHSIHILYIMRWINAFVDRCPNHVMSGRIYKKQTGKSSSTRTRRW